jgi:hypothetical protein
MTSEITPRAIEPPILGVADRDGTPEERELDEILEGSFPASDPPPWTLGVARTQALRLAPPHLVARKAVR